MYAVMSFLIVLIIRLLPVGLIVFLRKGAIQPWVLFVTVIVTASMLIINWYVDYLREIYYTNEYNPAIVDPIREQIGRYFPLRISLWLAYFVMLILIAVA